MKTNYPKPKQNTIYTNQNGMVPYHGVTGRDRRLLLSIKVMFYPFCGKGKKKKVTMRLLSCSCSKSVRMEPNTVIKSGSDVRYLLKIQSLHAFTLPHSSICKCITCSTCRISGTVCQKLAAAFVVLCA